MKSCSVLTLLGGFGVVCLSDLVSAHGADGKFFLAFEHEQVDPDHNDTRLVNDRPIIGILDQESFGNRRRYGKTYIAASYVKWVESAGGRAVPIHVLQDQGYYRRIFEHVNGILFPGGGQYLPGSSYYDAAKLLYQLAVKANEGGDYFPLWGTCLGFELLTVLAANDKNFFFNSDAENLPSNLRITQEGLSSKLFSPASKEILRALSNEVTTINFHSKAISSQNMTSSGLNKFFRTLSLNTDRKNRVYVSSIEAEKYPFYGVQFHPEKNNFEINDKQATPHSPAAVATSQYFADFFVNEARKSRHSFPSSVAEEETLFYNFSPINTGRLDKSTFAQIYAFNTTRPEI